MNRGIPIAAVVLALGVFACERKNEQPSDTTTTSGTVRGDQSGAGTPSQGAGVTETTGATDTTGGSLVGSGRDAGIASDRSGADLNEGYGAKDAGISASGSNAKGSTNNKSTTLGDGTSGQYTGGKGTYGGKATHGTGGGEARAKDGGH